MSALVLSASSQASLSERQVPAPRTPDRSSVVGSPFGTDNSMLDAPAETEVRVPATAWRMRCSENPSAVPNTMVEGVSLAGADVATALRIIAQQAGLGVVADQEVL